MQAIKPIRAGQRTFQLDFCHADCSEGLRDKSYELTTVERGLTMIVAKSTQHERVSMLLISTMTKDWLDRRFPSLEVETEYLEAWLDRNI